MMKPKHVPIRTCIACRTHGTKKGLIRIVRSPDGIVKVDDTGRANGRGAYLCLTMQCVQAARKKNRIAGSLKATVPPELYETLIERAAAAEEGD